MKTGFILFAALLSIAPLSGCSDAKETKPPEPYRHFFRTSFDFTYNGARQNITYLSSCAGNVNYQANGDRSVDGHGLTPFLWGKIMPDGGAVMISTPEFCYPEMVTGQRLKADYNPIIIHFQSAAEPWFGMAYVELAAFNSPIAVLTAPRTVISPAAQEEFIDWFSAHGKENWVTREKIALPENPFDHIFWKPGEKHIPTTCSYAGVFQLPPEAKRLIAPYRPPNADFWSSFKAERALRHHSRTRHGNKGPILFDGLGLDSYSPWGDQKRMPTFPASTDFTMNGLDAGGAISAERLAEAAKIVLRATPYPTREKWLVQANVNFRPELRGFGFCEGSVPDDVANWETTFRDVGGLYLFNGSLSVDSRTAGREVSRGNFWREEFFVDQVRLTLGSLGGKL